MKEQEVTNFARFYRIFNKMAYAGDKDELKRNIVRQYTLERTDSLREMTLKEYTACCNGLERLTGTQDGYRDAMRRNRSEVLHLMQKLGVDTTDWTRVNDFCRHPRIAGKEFYKLRGDELEALSVKLRTIMRKGGLKRAEAHGGEQKPEENEKKRDVVMLVKMDQGSGHLS